MPAPDLLAAIWDAADSDAGLTTAFGRPDWLWKDEAPIGEPLPYAVYFEAAVAPDGLNTGPDHFAEVSVQFNVFTTSKAAAELLGDRLRQCFAVGDPYVPLSAADGDELDRWAGDGDEVELDPAKGTGGSDVYVARVNLVWVVTRRQS